MGKVSRALGKLESQKKRDNEFFSESPSNFDEPLNAQEPEIIEDYPEIEEEVIIDAPVTETVAEKIIPPEPPESTEYWDERLLLATDTLSAVTESIRKIRTKILYPESGNKIKSVMICSCSAEEGKSFICANLGISLAQSMERHALMVDCDLRRPSLQKLFGQKAPKGLSDYLKNNVNLSDLINKTGLNKLSIIPSGHIPDNPAELISSDKMSSMIDELTHRYDDRLILFDTPPFHAASESLVLSQLVDKVVLVVRWGKSGKDNIKKTIDLIGRNKILGIVFNAHELNIIDRKVQGLGYQNYYTDRY